MSQGKQFGEFPDADYYEGAPEGMDIFSWSPSPPGAANPRPCTQVHLHFPLGGGRIRFVARFKGPGTLDRFIDALISHREDVWGKRP